MINLWGTYRDQTLVPESVMSSLCDSSEREKEKELDEFDQIAEDLGKYTRPASQDEYQDYIGKEPYDIGKMTALE